MLLNGCLFALPGLGLCVRPEKVQTQNEAHLPGNKGREGALASFDICGCGSELLRWFSWKKNLILPLQEFDISCGNFLLW